MFAQADQVVAKANAAAAEAAQRSEAEASHLRRELNALKKEKRDLVQHCSASDKELASLLVTASSNFWKNSCLL